jgi:uncharacterized membrane protein
MLKGENMKRYFATGLVAIIPALAVIWLITVAINFITAIVGTYSLWNVVVALVAALAGIFGLGFALVHSKLIRTVRNWLEEQIVERTPLVKTVYAFFKQFTSQAIEQKRYEHVVRVWPFGKNNTGMIGFLTDESTATVFVPSSPNPLSGQTYIGVKYETLPNWTYDDVLKYDMSVGMVQKPLPTRETK